MQKQPNRFIAPIVIAGITVGFLVSAYKFVFAKPKDEATKHKSEDMQVIAPDQIDAAP
ncbi:hypothetical protein [Acinetobacter guerrae]|uniref:hypothetical protein n=1 Tax=Acinetobacter guerrae TaxID=1843371 RepID=UPI00148DD41D|nr:hypothetical protein [Acinetobacter guerrae]